jgi:hypothetical protein
MRYDFGPFPIHFRERSPDRKDDPRVATYTYVFDNENVQSPELWLGLAMRG